VGNLAVFTEFQVSVGSAPCGPGITTASESINWFLTQTDKVVFNIDYPAIITNGLILNLDAGFAPSITSQPTNIVGGSYGSYIPTWYDISSGGNNGTLINGPTFNSDNGGSIVFDGVDDYVTIPNQVSASTEVTMLFWINKIFTNYYFHMNNRRNGPTDPTQTGIGSTAPISSTGWSQVGYFWSGNTSYFVFNGSVINSNTGGRFAYDNASSIVLYSANDNGYFSGNDAPVTNFSLQNSLGGAGGYQWLNRNNKVLGILSTSSNRRPFDGEMGSVLFYNRALSATEVLQNFNAQKGRFGL
jgi:hypothetical protein